MQNRAPDTNKRQRIVQQLEPDKQAQSDNPVNVGKDYFLKEENSNICGQQVSDQIDKLVRQGMELIRGNEPANNSTRGLRLVCDFYENTMHLESA